MKKRPPFDVPLLAGEQRRSWRTQVRVLAFITVYQSVHGYCPTVREIADDLSLPSLNTVARALQKLRDKELVTWEVGRVRTVRSTGTPKDAR